jgi:hypothetical protein
MPIKKHGVIIESPTEARQAERGPSILLLLLVSACLAVARSGFSSFVPEGIIPHTAAGHHS